MSKEPKFAEVKTEEKPAEKIDFSRVKIEPLFEEMVDFEMFSKSDYCAVKIKDCVAVTKSKKLLQFTLDDGSGTERTILSGIQIESKEIEVEACRLAGRKRFRPILMSTMTTVLGLIPLGFGGDALFIPMARLMMGGLAVAMVINLILVPIIYYIIEARIESKKE